MDPSANPDPYQDALHHALQRAVQVGSSVVTGAQVYIHLRRTQARAVAERDDRARRALAAQISADRQAARAGWAPALDPDWLRHADLLQTARAWGAAMPWADRAVPWYEPAAATAMRKCEDRLRDLHPFAMARYDRLRANGPAEAMADAAPLFGLAPRAHDGHYSPRAALAAAHEADLGSAAGRPVPDQANTPNRGMPPWQQDFPVPIREAVAQAAQPQQPPATAPARGRRQARHRKSRS